MGLLKAEVDRAALGAENAGRGMLIFELRGCNGVFNVEFSPRPMAGFGALLGSNDLVSYVNSSVAGKRSY